MGKNIIPPLENQGGAVTLQEVKTKTELKEYYKFNNLLTVDAKINQLIKTMKIRAMLGENEKTPEEILAGLEESTLLGYWKAS